jgi:ElaB/YqjD/DUF883 family membrane-anchored ribosome-binding protein
MANEPNPEVIRQQMQETRQGLQEKLETLENQVKETVQGATEAVSETVETVKETVKDTVETVKETVTDTVESVKETFNLSHHVEQHPWPAFACATLAGFVGTRLLMRYLPPTASIPARMATASPSPSYLKAAHYQEGGGVPLAEPQQKPGGFWSWLGDHYSDELNKLKGLAIGVAGGLVRDMVTEHVAPELGEKVKEVIDNFTTKLGGQPFHGSILGGNSQDQDQGDTERRPEEYTPRTERFTGTGSR